MTDDGANDRGGRRRMSREQKLANRRKRDKALRDNKKIELERLRAGAKGDAGAKGPKPAAQPRRPIDLERLAEIMKMASRRRRPWTPENSPFLVTPEQLHPPNALPPRNLRAPPKGHGMAMDQQVTGWASSGWAAAGSLFGLAAAEGQAFLGYPYLSELAQRPEYRTLAETIADDATRKWIDFDVTGTKQEVEERQREDEEDPEGRLERRQDRVRSADKMQRVKELKDEFDRLRVRDEIYQNCRNDNFFGRSHLFLDFGADLDGAGDDELAAPIGDGRDEVSKAKIAKGSFKGLRTIEPVWTYPMTYNAVNPLREDWYNPQVWYVLGKQIHVSRLLLFIGHPVPDLLKPTYSFGGLSLSQMAQPYVDIWLQTRQSVAQLIHSFSVMVLSTDMQQVMSPYNDLVGRVAEFNLYRDNMGAFVINKETEEFQNVAAPLSGLHELQAQSQEHICSVSRVPVMKFTGISPTGLNASSEGEIRAYYDTIAAYQNRFIRPNLTRVMHFAMLSLWGEVDEEITFEFEPLWEMSEKERAELQKAEAERDQTFVDGGAISPEEWRARIIDDPGLPYADLDPEDVPSLREEEMQGLVPEGAGRGLESILGEPGTGEPPAGGGGQGGGPVPPAPGGMLPAPQKGPEGGGAPEMPSRDPAFTEDEAQHGLPWAANYEWMRGFDLPTQRKDGAPVVRQASGDAAGRGLRVGSRVRYGADESGGTGRVFGFVRDPGGGHDQVAVLDHDNDRALFAPLDQVASRPVAMDAWEESKHPRGQPGNKGQFGSGGGAGEAPKPETGEGGSRAVMRSPSPAAAAPEGGKADRGKIFGEAMAAQLEKANAALEAAPKEARERHAERVAGVRKFFSSEAARDSVSRSVAAWAAKHAAGVAQHHVRTGMMMPVVHHVVEAAVEQIGLASVPGVTLGATAVAAYAAHHLMDEYGLTIGGVKELLVGAVRGAIDVLGGVKEVAARVAALEEMVGDKDDDVLDALILLLLALEELDAGDGQAGDEAFGTMDSVARRQAKDAKRAAKKARKAADEAAKGVADLVERMNAGPPAAAPGADEENSKKKPDAADAAKITKEQANYVDAWADPQQSCSRCSMFRDGRACTLVEGMISPQGHCDHFEAGNEAQVFGGSDAAFEESKHPRDDAGKFAPAASGGAPETAKAGREKPGKETGAAASEAKGSGERGPGLKASGLAEATALKREWSASAPDTVDEIAAAAPRNHASLALAGSEIAEALGARFRNPGPKSRARIEEKVARGKEPRDVRDAARGGFETSSPEQADRIVELLARRFEVADEGWQTAPSGYFDRKVMVRFPDGMVSEVQIWPPGMQRAKDEKAHPLYERWQRLAPGPEKAELLKAQLALFASVCAGLPQAWKAVVNC